MAEWIKTHDPTICCLQKTHFRSKDTNTLKVKGWKKILHANRNQNRAGVAILISDKIDFKSKNVTRDKEGHCILIKGSIQQEDMTIINIYELNSRPSKAVKQNLIESKREIDGSTILFGDFRTHSSLHLAESAPLPPMQRLMRLVFNTEDA